jgi:hypothetical protein
LKLNWGFDEIDDEELELFMILSAGLYVFTGMTCVAEDLAAFGEVLPADTSFILLLCLLFVSIYFYRRSGD